MYQHFDEENLIFIVEQEVEQEKGPCSTLPLQTECRSPSLVPLWPALFRFLFHSKSIEKLEKRPKMQKHFEALPLGPIQFLGYLMPLILTTCSMVRPRCR